MSLSKIKSNELRRYLHTKSFKFSTYEYPFKEVLQELYGCELSYIHEHLGTFDQFERANDQSTLAHKVFYSNFNKSIKPIYERFIKKFIVDILSPHQFYYQVIPTFRIGLPGNKFVGEYHKDSFYNHQSYELNFNVGLANYIGQPSLKTEKEPESKEFILLESPYGNIFSFDHIDCLHGSDPNETSKTMVSFDFRLALKELYFDTDASSVNLATSFVPGSYFSKDFEG